jgi:flagellar biosynthesis/type III secretory pathway M-ring protein FliF/YscJ
MIALDLITGALLLGVGLLVVTTSLMAMQILPSRSRQKPSPAVRRALPDGKARASIARGELPPAKVIRPQTELVMTAAGQIEKIRNGLDSGQPLSVEEASALARFLAEHDPEIVAEVITQWISEDMSNDPGAAR